MLALDSPETPAVDDSADTMHVHQAEVFIIVFTQQTFAVNTNCPI